MTHRKTISAALALVLMGVQPGARAQEEKDVARSDRKSRPPIRVELAVATDAEAGHTWLRATFKNLDEKKSLAIYPPQGGSYYGWLSPVYRLDVRKKGAEKSLELPPRCGNHGASYDATRITIAPRKSASVKVYPPFRLEKGETYTIRLEYEVREKRYPGPHYRAPSTEKVVFRAWPKGTFVGSVVSKPITVTW